MQPTLKIAVFIALACVAVSFAASASPDRNVLFDRTNIPSDWIKLNRTEGTHTVRMIVAMKQQNLHALEEVFWSVSTPGNPRYRQFMSKEDISTLVSPSAETVQAVRNWIKSVDGSKRVADLGDAVEVLTSVRVAEQLLHAEFYTFQHKSGRTAVRILGEYSVPMALAQHVDLVAGVTEFPILKPTPKLGAITDPAVVPQTIEASYGTPADHAADPSSGQGVIEFEGQSFAPSDLQAFATGVNRSIPALASDHIVGPNDPSSAGVEATLDIQYIAAVGRGSTNWFWLEAGEAWLYGFATHFFSTSEVPNVVSISYGWSEAAQCQSGIGGSECSQLGVDSAQYVARVNTEFQKIGARGVSILVASGDSGANGRTDGLCLEKHLNPTFPAASPYVTAVGATELHDAQPLSDAPPACSGRQCASTGTEAAVSFAQSQFASGGGFSNVAAQPSYQADAVKAYFNSGVDLPPSTYYNASGRGYPDVAAFGSNVIVHAQGGFQGVGGTSCSSPIFAGVVALLNDASIAKSGKPLGFLNPMLYQLHAQNPDAFNDVTVGDNICTEEGCGLFGSCKGFKCAKGWDPVTGLGSPVFSKMLQHVQSL